MDDLFGEIVTCFQEDLTRYIIAKKSWVDIRFGRYEPLKQVLEDNISSACKKQKEVMYSELCDDLRMMISTWCKYNVEEGKGELRTDDSERFLQSILYRFLKEFIVQAKSLKV